MAKILCIEDDTSLLQLLNEELSDAGHTVVLASDGCSGLEKILEEKPDLVISDISMPRMNGYVLLKTVREQHREFAEMPIILLSALADRDHIIDGLDLGADDYLTKPIDYEMLLARVDARLREAKRMVKQKEADKAKLVDAYEKIGTQPVIFDEDVVWK